MTTEINAGRVAMVPKGEWSASTAYVRLDVVHYNGSSYVARQDSTGQNPSTATTYWQLLASGVDPSNYYTKNETNTKLGGKQDALVSGQNIKSINGQSVLGTGNLELGELFVVRMTRNNSNSVYTADKSVSEIYEASYTNGKPVIAVMRDINNPVFILTDCDPDGDSYVFSSIESNSVTTLRWQQHADDYTYELETLVLQPHLVSGTNIKSVNNESLLGSGNVDIVGKSAYQSYVDTTTDSPVKTEAEWVTSLKGEDGVSLGEVAIADDLDTNDARKVLSARQGYNLGQKVNNADAEPTAGSDNLVKSGGVQNELALGAVYDVSAKNPTAGPNNDGKWESLSALLSDANLNTLIPTAVRKGGMSVKFVQSSDNKYVQYFLTKDEWSASEGDWEKMNLEEEVSQLGQELYPNYMKNRYIDHKGNIVEAQYWSITSFVAYTTGDVAWLAGYTSGSRCLVFYDSSYNPIRGAFYTATQTETTISSADIPANAKYIRASFFSNAENSYVKIGGNIVWEKDNGLISKVDELENLSQEVNEIKPDNAVITSDVTIGQNGYYIDQNGERQSYASYCISGIIHLQKGDTLSANLQASATAYLCKYNGSDTSYIVILYVSKTINSFTYTAEEDMDIVMCGAKSAFSTYTIQRETIKAASQYSVEQLSERVDALENNALISFINPYAGVDYNNLVTAQSHEHSYTKDRLESAYNRGIRLFAVSHYKPSVPRYPLSKTPLTWMDYKSREAVDNGDLELVERVETKNVGITQLDTNSGIVYTDDIPQIANAERPYIRSDIKFYPEHFNILGLLWGDPGVSTANNEQSTAWKKAHSLETIEKINELLADETMWQFGTQYAFGTINHNKSVTDIKAMLDTFPQIFKAMELFNQGYSEGWNKDFRDAYDDILRQGYKIWGTAVVDWQNDWATWDYTTAEEKEEWTSKYNNLSPIEQSEYGSIENYYLQTGRYKFDRGANVLLMPNGYENLTPELQAKEGIKAYIQGRYYMVGLGNYSMRMAIDGNTITFRVSDICPKIKIITANGVSELTNTDTARYTPSETDKYVRFEAAWDDGDFIFSNPIFIDLIY